MGRDLYDKFPVARTVFEEADEALGFSLTHLIFEGPEDQLKLTEHTQPAILTVSVAAARVLAERGIQPTLAAGHSLGEYSAHVVAGTLSFADAQSAQFAPVANTCSKPSHLVKARWPQSSASMPRSSARSAPRSRTISHRSP